MTESTYYKVLVDGKSCHGGDLVWSLPTANADGTWTPGDWHEADGAVRVCARGLHLTTDPMRWPKFGMQVFTAEGAGASDTEGDKTAFQRARLLAPADDVVPGYWRDVEAFVRSIPSTPWFQPQGDPDPDWRVFDTRDSAWDSARNSALNSARNSAGASARNSAWDSAWDSARNSARNSACLLYTSPSPRDS